MATRKSQRIFIWVITIVMAVGTVAGFVAMILAPENSKADQQRLADLTAQYQKDVENQSAELSKKYFDTFKKYSARVSVFDKASIKKLTTKDLLKGSGTTITKESTFTAYYIGWNPKGKVFDQSIDGNKLKAPFSVTPGGVIEGWTEGLAGMKVGGVRELNIPADLAYGKTGAGGDIPPNTPLKFVVMVIPTPEEVKMPQELVEYYQQAYGAYGN